MEDWILELINRRERQMLLHSYLYYKRDYIIWDDIKFDTYARELAHLIKANPEIAEKAQWAVQFRNWDGSTGYYLPFEDPWVTLRGEQLIQMDKIKNGTVKPNEIYRQETLVSMPKQHEKKQQTILTLNKKEVPKKPKTAQMKLF